MVLSILLGKISLFLLQKIKGTAGSTWPGHLVIETNRKFIKQILSKNRHLKVVLIAGTNGKTTTTKSLFHILTKNGIQTIHNDSGANLLNGFASTLIKNTNLFGKIEASALLFEIDENSLPLILSEINNPSAVILLNLFRDQLDRYGEVNITSEKWATALGRLSKDTTIFANVDDPQIAFIAKGHKAKVNYFSVVDKLKRAKQTSHAADSIVCPNCRHDLIFSKVSYSHIGNYKCPNCKFSNPKSFAIDLKTSLKGVFNIYNLTASILVASEIFNIGLDKITTSLLDFKPAFGRQEEIEIDGKKILLLLSKNPTGFNESLKVVKENNFSNLLFLLNDKIPDGRDISWIWDVDFEELEEMKTNIYVGGDRCYDLANRLAFANLDTTTIENLRNLLHVAITKTAKGETLAILPTYSAMLEVRKILIGRNIL